MNGDLDPLPGIFIIIFIILIFADFICSAFGQAVLSLSDSDLKEKDDEEEDPDKERAERENLLRKKLAGLADRPETVIRVSVFWRILTAVCGALILNQYPDGGIWFAVIFSVLVTYILGWALPGYVGKVHGLSYIRKVFSVWKIFSAVSRPFTFVFEGAATLLAKLFASDPSKIKEEVTEDEIISMVNEGHQQGTVDEDEAEMIRNIFEMDEKQAQDIMTNRGKIIGLPGELTLDEAIRTMVNSPNSRFPVYEDNIDNIIGALYLKDAMSFHMKELFNSMSIKSVPGLLREVKFVPETRRIDELFSDMQKSQMQIAIVADEYGETAGLVTMEDILEEIVGNIFDEYDRIEKDILPAGAGKWRLSGMAHLSDVSKSLGIPENEDYETLNGYLTAKLDHVPDPDDVGKVIVDQENGIRFIIKSVYQNTVQWALAEKVKKDI